MSFSSFFVSAGRSIAGDAGSETNVMQQTIRIIEAEEERTDHFRSFAVAKSPNDAVRAAEVFDLLHPVALTGSVVEIAGVWR